ncbi:MAG: histidine kinase [Clostridia bacterium]
MKRILNRLSRISVRTYLMIMLSIVLPMFFASTGIRYQYEQYIQEQLSQQIISSMMKSEEAIYTSFQNLAGISSAVVTNNALLKVLEEENPTNYEIGRQFDECVNYARVNNLYATDSLMLTLFDRSQRCYANWSQNYHDYRFLLEQPWVQEAIAAKGHLVWNLFSPSFVKGEQAVDLVSVARVIPATETNTPFLGLLIVSMPQSQINEVLSKYCYAADDSVFMFGDDGIPILQYTPVDEISPQEREAAFKAAQQHSSGNLRMQTAAGTKLVSYYTLRAPWSMGEQTLRIAHFTDFQTVIHHMNEFSKRMSIMAGFVLTIAMLVTLLIVSQIVKPIRSLAHTMGHYELGDPPKGLNMERQDEIGHLNRSFLQLTDHVQELFHDLDEEYKIKEKYRYESLRAQLNPHFLFNTLTTLRYMAMMQHADHITAGIDSLATVLKYSMGRDGDRILLREEVAHVKSYVDIQNMRFGQKIIVEDDFEPDVLGLYTLRFILQPVVENAIIHGFQDKTPHEMCLIRLYGHREENALHLFVEDNGSGISLETLEKLNKSNSKRERMTGIGFSNVKEMIELCFGEGYTVTVHSTPDIGTVVHFILPILKEGEDACGKF